MNQYNAIHDENGKGIGRGRGWLKLNEDTALNKSNIQNIKPKKPGGLKNYKPLSQKPKSQPEQPQLQQPQPQQDEEEIDLHNQKLIYHIELWKMIFNGTDKKRVNTFMTTFERVGLQEDDLSEMIGALHGHSLEATSFALKYSRFFATYNEMRRFFLNYAQSDFENIDGIRQLSREKSRNAFLMLYCWYMTEDLLPLIRKNFTKIICDYMKKFLTDSPDEEDVILISKTLHKCYCAAKSKDWPLPCIIEVMNLIRDLVTGETLTSNCKLWLLLGLEMCHDNFELLQYYSKHLDKRHIDYFQSKEEDIIKLLEESYKVSTEEEDTKEIVKKIESVQLKKAGRPILGLGARSNNNSNDNTEQPDGNK